MFPSARDGNVGDEIRACAIYTVHGVAHPKSESKHWWKDMYPKDSIATGELKP